jgi:CheY-like chemotaxis protein
MLADFYLRFHALMPKGSSAHIHPALRLCAGVEALLKKLLEKPRHCTPSTLLTISAALKLLGELCTPGVKPGLATDVPIRLLAVDDDPVARRAITCALQIAFEKPESVDNGDAALALATQRPFDAIFMDIEMPGMDGFTACMRIHDTTQNCNTPVVFVTSHNDFKARTQATVSGGSDFIAKPFLTAEVTLKALTFALRGRLQKLKLAEAATQLPADQRNARAQESRRSREKNSSRRRSKSKQRQQASKRSADKGRSESRMAR